jgi:hypothetical protein
MTAKPAQYLLRFDDLCPTMHRARWQRFVPLIERFRLKPILAVVPQNRDPDLELEPPNANFWQEMRQMEQAGAAIGLHGYTHVCNTRGRSRIPLHSQTEFAGVPEETQRAWIHAGLETLRSEGLNPSIWVAPRHGFDLATLRALRKEGIDALSDGFAPEPFQEHGISWIPQQLWAPAPKPSGLWTICLHANSAADGQVHELEAFLERNAAQFTSVERVLQEWPPRRRNLSDRIFHHRLTTRIALARLRRRWGIA